MIGVLNRFLVKRPEVDGRRGVGDTSTVRSVIVKNSVNVVDDDDNNAASPEFRCWSAANSGAPAIGARAAGRCRDCRYHLPTNVFQRDFGPLPNTVNNRSLNDA